MTFLSQILGTIIGFCVVMLAASLIVMSIVQVVHYLEDRRGKTLGEMLGALHQAYRHGHGDTPLPGDRAQSSFVLDVLTFPVLHAPSELARFAGLGSVAAQEQERQRLAQRVEHIDKADLIEIVRRLAGAPVPAARNEPDAGSDAGVELPVRWYRHLPEPARQLKPFLDHIDYWFTTVEGTSSEQFKISARRLTAVVSCALAVVFHIDSIQMVSQLYSSAGAQEELARRADDLLDVARRLGATNEADKTLTDRVELLDGVTQNFAQLNSILNEPDLALGWQNSRIAQALCAESGECRNGMRVSDAPPLSLAILLSLAGIAASSALLSLGAPFWAERLKEVLRLSNTVARLKTPPRSSSPRGDRGAEPS